jgi:hypothetical protein
VAPIADPLDDADPDDAPDGDAEEGDDADAMDDVVTLRGSDPTTLPLLALLVVRPFGCSMVWLCCPWAVVMPRNKTAMMMTSFIALLLR